ncbi:MAG: gluconokinase [Sphingomonadales bacterium]|nr:gluconokinase [Sphingomonadales bacterium]
MNDQISVQDKILVVIMGVMACGKSTISSSLSKTQQWPLLEGDDFHPLANRTKMALGKPLTNEDRFPWLDAIAKAVNEYPENWLVLACSALNEEVRSYLARNVDRPCKFILLNVPKPILVQRIQQRQGHFMPAKLLKSQFAALELPAEAIQIDGTLPPEQICELIIAALNQ